MDNLNYLVVSKNDTLKHAMEVISSNQKGAVVVVDEDGRAVGVLSDGDIRRAILRDSSLITPVEKIMNISFIYASESELSKASDLLEAHPGVTLLPIISPDNKLVDIIAREAKEKMWNYYQNKKRDLLKSNNNRLLYLLKVIKNKIHHKDKNKILDIGVGSGFFEEIALKSGLDVFCVDPNTETIEILRSRFSGYNDFSNKALVGYAQKLPFLDNYFDVVLVSELLHLLPSEILDKSLAEISRVLKKGGLLIGTVPAREKLDEQSVCCPNCGCVFHRWGAVQSFDILGLKKHLSELFIVKNIKEDYFRSVGLNWKGKIVAATKIVLNKIGIKGNNNSIVFIAEKK